MHVERIETRPEITRHIREAWAVEQREHVVVLPPQLTKPLHRQRLWHDDEATFDVDGVHEVIENQARFNRLAETDFVGKQPPHRAHHRRVFRNIELVWEQANATTQEGADAALADRAQALDVANKPGIGRADRHHRTRELRTPNR